MAILETSDPLANINFKCICEPCIIPNTKQVCTIANTRRFGESLFIDGMLQSSLSDEYIFHEMLVHSLLAGLREKKNILIIGGAEGCLLREVLKWDSVEHVTQIDWDEGLITYFKNDSEGVKWNSNAYDDPRVTLVHQDIVEWLEVQNNSINPRVYNAIFVDLFDPDSSDSIGFLEIVCRQAKKLLVPNGGLVLNSGPIGITEGACTKLAVSLKNMFGEPCFERVAMKLSVPSFMGDWCLLLAVPKKWSTLLYETTLPPCLKRYSNQELHRCSSWSNDTPAEIRDFWKKSPSELENCPSRKLIPVGEDIYISEYYNNYGC